MLLATPFARSTGEGEGGWFPAPQPMLVGLGGKRRYGLPHLTCPNEVLQTVTELPVGMATPPRGLDLPTVSADELRSCRVRVNSTTLLACALLLPAGTGTQSLHDFMQTMLGTSAPRSFTERSLRPTNVHHLHHVRMAASMSAPRTEGKPKCFIMSLRDPVARLKSGFAFLKKGWGPGLNKQVALPSNAARTYSGFIAAMRDPENADHRFAQGLYWSSVSKPTQAQPLHWDSVLGGHNFLVSQLDYLRGWKAHCRSGELHFMCAIIRVAHSQAPIAC